MELQQDALDEAFRRHKQYFHDFLSNDEVRGVDGCGVSVMTKPTRD